MTDKVGIMTKTVGAVTDKVGIVTENVGDMTDKVGIYIHVPFCRSKCYYCDFCSRCGSDAAVIDAYVGAACREIDAVAENIRRERRRVQSKSGASGKIDSAVQKCGETVGADVLPVADTVYFGGGTPTLLTVEQFERLIEAVKRNFGIAEGAEITAEANPKTADCEKLAAMRRAGINRLSIGMQSVHDGELKALGRIHNFADFERMFSDAREVGFDNISADLMYGIPEQTAESFAESVRRLAAMDPEHISSYCLTVEEGTNFYRRRDNLSLPDEDAVAEMYREMSNILSENGYNKYEISNFAKTGRKSRHNLKYWEYDDYIGIGPAAHSFFGGVRSSHSRDIEAYIAGEDIIDDTQKIEGDEAVSEYVMLAMRLSRGVDIAKFKAKFGLDFYEKFGEKIAKFSPEFIEKNAKNCRFTSEGMFVSNYVLSEMLDF